MSYVRKNLSPSEKIIEIGRVHWFVYFPGFTCMIITLMVVSHSQVFAGCSALLGCYLIMRGYIVQSCTELVLTDKRLIAKTGFFSKQTMLLPYGDLYRVRVDELVLGQILGFGNIRLINRKKEEITLENMSNPADFRKKVLLTIEKL